MQRTSDVPLDIQKILEEYSLLIYLENLRIYYQNQISRYTFESELEVFNATFEEIDAAAEARLNFLAVEKAIEILKQEIEFDLTNSNLTIIDGL